MTAAKEILANPGDLFQSLRYLQDQARQGRFDNHSPAYLVLLHLAMNMWTKVPNNENADLGMVMYGRSSVDSIARYTAMSGRTVQRALTWLSAEGWIDTERSYMTSGREDRRYIMVLLDGRAHRDRERRRSLDRELASIMGEGDSVTPPGGDSVTPPVG